MSDSRSAPEVKDSAFGEDHTMEDDFATWNKEANKEMGEGHDRDSEFPFSLETVDEENFQPRTCSLSSTSQSSNVVDSIVSPPMKRYQ